jgi:cyclohexadieny/prephenate dehydrogenase
LEANLNIGIIGAGLIGSSLIRALNSFGPDLNILVFETNSSYSELLAGLHLKCTVCSKFTDVAHVADIIFVCVPVKSIAEIVCSLIPEVGADTVITDVGSAKMAVIRDISKNFPNYRNFVPGHPMSGGENSGPVGGHGNLFVGKRYLLTPEVKTSKIAIDKVKSVIELIGADCFMLDPDQHDQIMAMVSHLPHLYAFALMNAASEESSVLDTDVLKYVGGGFTDVTRIAASGTRICVDIFVENEKNLIETYQKLKNQIDLMLDAIKKRDVEKLAAFIESARTARIKMSEEKAKNG